MDVAKSHEIWSQCLRHSYKKSGAYQKWRAQFTQVEVSCLERVQKTELAIIRGVHQTNYEDALEYFKIDSLKSRREARCLNFLFC